MRGPPKTPLLTVDAIVCDEQGRVLMIERRNPPHGWALPGGFVDVGESCENAVARETMEETGLEAVSVRQFRTYSDPGRDPRGHTVAVVYIVEVRGEVQAADDARDARWYELDALPGEVAFDHRQILTDFVASGAVAGS